MSFDGVYPPLPEHPITTDSGSKVVISLKIMTKMEKGKTTKYKKNTQKTKKTHTQKKKNHKKNKKKQQNTCHVRFEIYCKL